MESAGLPLSCGVGEGFLRAGWVARKTGEGRYAGICAKRVIRLRAEFP